MFVPVETCAIVVKEAMTLQFLWGQMIPCVVRVGGGASLWLYDGGGDFCEANDLYFWVFRETKRFAFLKNIFPTSECTGPSQHE